MKKNAVLWLLPLAALLFISFPFDLSALSTKDENQLTKLEAKQASGKKLSRSEEKTRADLRAQKDLELTIAPTLTPAPSEPAPSVEPEVKDTADSGNSSKVVIPPDWVIDQVELKKILAELGIDRDGVYVGIGSAKNESDPLQAIRMAESRARQDIAFQYSTLVGATINDLWQNIGGKPITEDQIVGKQSVDGELYPVTVVRRELKNDTWWVIATTSTKLEPIITTKSGANTETAMEKALRQMEESLERDRLLRNR